MTNKFWFILIPFNILSYLLFSFKTGAVVFILSFLYSLWRIGLFRSIIFLRNNFEECLVYYYDYVGEYYNISKEFEKISILTQKYKLKHAIPFGIYYDDPRKVDPKTCRAVVGILKRGGKQEEDWEILKESNYRKDYIPTSLCLSANFPHVNSMSLVIGIKKFYNSLRTNIKKESWRNAYGLKEDIPCSVEIYGESLLEFFVPIENAEEFNLLKIKGRKKIN